LEPCIGDPEDWWPLWEENPEPFDPEKFTPQEAATAHSMA